MAHDLRTHTLEVRQRGTGRDRRHRSRSTPTLAHPVTPSRTGTGGTLGCGRYNRLATRSFGSARSGTLGRCCEATHTFRRLAVATSLIERCSSWTTTT